MAGGRGGLAAQCLRRHAYYLRSGMLPRIPVIEPVSVLVKLPPSRLLAPVSSSAVALFFGGPLMRSALPRTGLRRPWPPVLCESPGRLRRIGHRATPDWLKLDGMFV